MKSPGKLLSLGLLLFTIITAVNSTPAQTPVQSKDRDRGQMMLSRIKDYLKDDYYDPNYHGMDLDTRFKTASEKIKQASSIGQIFGVIAQVLSELDDSHTYFIPPSRTTRVAYGWGMQMFGDRCYVSSVTPGSDAETKGVKPGDEILEAGGHKLGRSNLWKFRYLYNVLRPQAGIRVTLRSPNGEPRQLDLLAKQSEGKKVVDLTIQNEWLQLEREAQKEARLERDRFKSFPDQLLIWKMNDFDLSDSEIDDAMSNAKKHKALILDLRGNPGGFVSSLARVLANLFDREIKIGDSKFRKETKPLLAKSRGEKAFKGKLTILVDSRSASAAEILARVVQLEKRGTVIGDQSSGQVMASKRYQEAVGIDVVVYFGVSITQYDLIMTDGKSLEHVGVTPDEIRIPTAEDLATGRDVVLAYAASLDGVTLDPLEAGKLFPIDPRVIRQ